MVQCVDKQQGSDVCSAGKNSACNSTKNFTSAVLGSPVLGQCSSNQYSALHYSETHCCVVQLKQLNLNTST